MADFNTLTSATARQTTDEVAAVRGSATVRMALSVLLAGLLNEAQVDARAAVRYTNAEKAKLGAVEADATADQTGAEIVTLLEALTGNARLNASTALRLIADAIDTELGNNTWRSGGAAETAAQILTKLLTVDGAGSGLDADLLDGVQVAALARLAGAIFTGAVTIGSASGGALTVDGANAGNDTIMKIFTPDSGTQKAFGAGRQGEFDWVQFAGEVVAGKPGFALGPGTARDTNLYRDAANVLKTDDAFVAEGTVSGATPTDDAHLTTKAYVDNLVNPVQTHTNYAAISSDNAFTAAEFLAGTSSMTTSIVMPTFTSPPNQFVAIAVPDAEGDITDIASGGISTFNGFERVTGTITISGEAHKVWRSRAAVTDTISGVTYIITQA